MRAPACDTYVDRVKIFSGYIIVGVSGEGLRERKKAETRKRISDVATALFARRGFDAVTVADVAEAANVSKMTVFNYFPRKEDLLLDRQPERLDGLRRAIAERGPDTSVVEALRTHCQELLASGHPTSGAITGAGWFFEIVRDSPALMTRALEQEREIEETLAEELAREWGEGPRARLVAAMLAAAVNTAYHIAVDAITAGRPAAEVRREQAGVIDQAFDLVARGVHGTG